MLLAIGVIIAAMVSTARIRDIFRFINPPLHQRTTFLSGIVFTRKRPKSSPFRRPFDGPVIGKFPKEKLGKPPLRGEHMLELPVRHQGAYADQRPIIAIFLDASPEPVQ